MFNGIHLHRQVGVLPDGDTGQARLLETTIVLQSAKKEMKYLDIKVIDKRDLLSRSRLPLGGVLVKVDCSSRIRTQADNLPSDTS
jgi:hypothetical protein